MRIKSAPAWFNDDKPEHLLTDSDKRWISWVGNNKNQAFVFELDLEPRQWVTGVEWKAALADSWAPARLSLEAKSGEEWRHLGESDSLKATGWQARALSPASRSKLWKVTFLRNHGSPYFMEVRAIRFIVQTMTFRRMLWLERPHTDVKVVSGSLYLPAHRGILATASPVLAGMLAEAHQQQKHEIEVTDVGEGSVQDWLEYMYTESIAKTADFGVVALGHKYAVGMLAEQAAPQALENLSPANVVRAISMVRPYADEAEVKPIWEALMNKALEHLTPENVLPVIRLLEPYVEEEHVKLFWAALTTKALTKLTPENLLPVISVLKPYAKEALKKTVSENPSLLDTLISRAPDS